MRKKGRTARAKTSKKKRGKKPGTPAFIATPDQRDQVETMTGFGMTQSEQAVILGIAERTLNTHFIVELKRGAAKADAAVMQNLFKIATGDGPNSGKCAIFWTKVRRRWHEVQRVIHGFDPEAIKMFVQQVIVILRRELPQKCPHCKTNLDLPKKIAGHLRTLSMKMTESLPPSQIVSADPKETV